jgi:hypothetical protein
LSFRWLELDVLRQNRLGRRKGFSLRAGLRAGRLAVHWGIAEYDGVGSALRRAAIRESGYYRLQVLKDPAAIAILKKTAFSVHKYLASDENFGLARKCTWALADIGTPDAHLALTRLAACNNAMIAGYSRKRLDNWQKESDRKGF